MHAKEDNGGEKSEATCYRDFVQQAIAEACIRLGIPKAIVDEGYGSYSAARLTRFESRSRRY